MATQIQFRRGSAAQHAGFTGALGEVTVNTTNDSLHVHDASTAGGFEQARADLSNHSNVGILTAVTFSGNLTGNVTGTITGNADTATYATTAGIATYASTAGVSTNAQGLTGSPNITVTNVSANDIQVGGALTVTGNLIVNGTTTTINSTTITVDDKNIELASTASPSDSAADGGGITLKGDTDHTITWDNTYDSWDFSEHVNIVTGKEYKISDTSVLSATTLGSNVVNSSLTSVGTIASGVWQGTAIANAYLANSTISGVSLGSNLATATFATSGTGLSGSATYNGSGAATFTVTSNATSANTASAIVARDASGDFSAGTITATLSGNATSATSATTATNITCSANNTTDETTYLVFVDGATGGQGAETDTALTYNPSTNTLAAGTFNSTSDINLKKDIEIVSNANDILKEIRGVRFAWKENNIKSVGVIAQEVEKVLPELVATDNNDTKTVNYDALIGVLIEAVKDQQKQIDYLKQEIDSLK